MLRSFGLFTLAFVGSLAFAYIENDSPDQYSGKPSMNGYRFADYKDFQKKWKLVTVRFRKDTGELRFTYANPLAWKTLNAGSTQYPDGAVFAKIGFMTEADPAFASSAVPAGARRYQFMVRDSKKHANTDGWGYALFDGKGLTFPEEPKATTRSCVACHRLVPERGYVFSQLLDSSDVIKSFQSSQKNSHQSLFRNFEVSSLPVSLKNLLSNKNQVSLVDGALRKYIFQGTLDEIVPLLLVESTRTGRGAILASEDFTRYSIVQPSKEVCPKGKSFELIQTQLKKTDKGEYETKKSHLCDG